MVFQCGKEDLKPFLVLDITILIKLESTIMNRLILSILMFTCGFSLPLMAQKKNTTPAQTTTSKSAHSSEQLIQNYRFEEAARLLQREIETARSANRSTIRLENDLKRANMGQDMLRGTERVTFVDSFKVSRKQVLQALRLSAESGSIVNMETEGAQFEKTPKKLGKTGYLSQLADRIIFATTDSTGNHQKLHAAYRMGKKWGSPIQLNGMSESNEDQDFPFMMPDGVTLYYAAQGDDCLGGYDIFVTRYNTETKQFLKAENLGMPFNSPANDYLLAIDEANNLGWLVTDRFQKPDSACVYVFIPTTTRDVYDLCESNHKQVLNAAKLQSIKATQTDKEAVAEAKKRLKQVMQQSPTTHRTQATNHIYVINDNKVYTNLSQFKSEGARRIAVQADQVAERIANLTQKQDDLQRQVALKGRNEATLSQLKDINNSLPKLREQLNALLKNMRKTEIQ